MADAGTGVKAIAAATGKTYVVRAVATVHGENDQPPGACIGTPTGARGNLRDSDDTPSQHGYPPQNWSIHFDVAVP